MKKQTFEEFLGSLFLHEETMAEYSLYIASYFGLKEYEALFSEYENKESNDEEVNDDEVYQKHLEMMNFIKWRYPFRYRKMDRYTEENY